MHRLHLFRGEGKTLPICALWPSLLWLWNTLTASLQRVRLSQSVGYGPVCCGCRIHRLHLCSGVRFSQCVSYGTVCCGCGIHRLHLCGGGVGLSWGVYYGPVYCGCRLHGSHLCRGGKTLLRCVMIQSAVAVEYTDCISAGGVRLSRGVSYGPVCRVSRIHRLHLCKGGKTLPMCA